MSIPPQLGRLGTLKASPPTRDAAHAQEPRRRTYSNASASSAASADSPRSEEQFVFSPHQTPAHEASSFFSSRDPSNTALRSGSMVGNPSAYNSPSKSRHLPTNPSSATSNKSPTPRSRPIAIELPPSVSRKINTSSVYTPIEPLSGRGDISGGYFPFHEDPDKRVTRPHPFHADTQQAARHVDSCDRSIDGSAPIPTTVCRPPLPKPAISEPPGTRQTMVNSVNMPQSRGHTPVTSYVPSGYHEIPMPVGKYYPSNYEAQQKHSNNQPGRTSKSSLRPPSSGGPSSIKSDTVVPQINRTDSSRGRSNSDAKRRLQQYQRDMVTQATLAARQIGQTSTTSLAAAHGVPVQKLQLAPHRPASPRLEPANSPGPVTPMELEGYGAGDGGYLTRGRAVPSPDAGRDQAAIARAMRAEEERRRREGRGSPAVEAGGFGF